MPEYPETAVETLDRISEEVAGLRDRLAKQVERDVDRTMPELEYGFRRIRTGQVLETSPDGARTAILRPGWELVSRPVAEWEPADRPTEDEDQDDV